MIGRSCNVGRMCALLLATLTCTACGGDPESQRSADRQACLKGDAEPADGVRACSRLLQARDRKLMPEADVLYHRGSAFEALNEFAHAKIDYQRALALNPDHDLAKQRLEPLQ